MTQHIVYRVFDGSELVYVGCTTNLEQRLDFHASHGWWWPASPVVTSVVFPDRASARTAERAAIRDEEPSANMGDLPPRRAWSTRRYENYLRALELSDTPALQNAEHVRNVRREYARRLRLHPLAS